MYNEKGDMAAILVKQRDGTLSTKIFSSGVDASSPKHASVYGENYRHGSFPT